MYMNYYGDITGGAVAAISAFSTMFGLAAAVCMIIGMWKCFVKAGKPGWHAVVPFLNVYTLCEVGWTKKHGIVIIVLEAVGIFFSFFGGILIGTSSLRIGLFGGWESIRSLSDWPGSMGIGVAIFVFSSLTIAVGAIFLCVAYVKLGRSFGKSGGFLVGLFLVAPVFLMILGFGRDQYIGTPFRQATGPYVSPNQNQYNQNQYNQNPYNQNQYNQNPYNQNPYNQGQQNQNMYNQAPNQDANGPGTSGGNATVCPHCGKPYPSGTKFCANCGGPLS